MASAAAGQSLRIENLSTFHSVIGEFAGRFNNVTLANTRATAAYFAQVTPDSGAHASNAYGVSNNVDGSATVTPLVPVPTS